MFITNYIDKSTKKIIDNVTHNILNILTHETKFKCILDIDDINQSHTELQNYSKLPSPAKKPYPNRLYLLSNPKNHIFSLVSMDNSYNVIKFFIFIDFNKTKNIFCKIIYNYKAEIFASLVDNDKKYYAIKNYGNSYFFDPGFEIINIMSLHLQNC